MKFPTPSVHCFEPQASFFSPSPPSFPSSFLSPVSFIHGGENLDCSLRLAAIALLLQPFPPSVLVSVCLSSLSLSHSHFHLLILGLFRLHSSPAKLFHSLVKSGFVVHLKTIPLLNITSLISHCPPKSLMPLTTNAS